ncbi:MAG: hypothetical protein A2Y62_04810 [Candidatus Fischerbacteria bacterium RBG_13_37_8]|uniref:prolyl oligopeptidase n=1 Tax=Candidatus Fischerbacteria bacterium RBG_13_37_8 TaxID=1817863 RepID=A0A1F5VHN3_9BACT|nr:MAG: hypothetical protein A2Y62_04810 [Candidatus Fischerbacteria bacterium RBG_13_37_8]
MSSEGSESGDVHIFEAGIGKQIDVIIERVNGGTAGGSLAWIPDNSGFYYTRYPREGERSDENLSFYQQVWFHKLGSIPEEDSYVAGKDFPRIAEIQIDVEPVSGNALLTVQYGDSGKFAFYLVDPDKTVKQLYNYEDGVAEAIFGSPKSLYLISKKNAPRKKILRIDLAHPGLDKAQIIIPEGKDTIIDSFGITSRFIATKSYLYIPYQLGGPSEIQVFDHDGNQEANPAIPAFSNIHEVTALDGDEILYSFSSYITPKEWNLFNPANGKTKKTRFIIKSPVDFSDTEVVREYATSKDGTKIPVNIIRKKDTKLDSSSPVLLSGYGGFDVSVTPRFNPVMRIWIEKGGVYAVAIIRGGGEYGEEWHKAGMLTKKQNCFDDFAAVMKFLIDSGYTKPDLLTITGGSNGGLLMGAMITQHPDLFKATVSFVGLYDMVHMEQSPNGQFNIPEYGTVKDPEQFKAMYDYSPYHHVKDGTAYPEILFMTGANDPRVDPMHSRKMTARLQAATSSKNPILLRTSSGTGHGIGTPLSETIEELTAMYSFLIEGVKARH